MIPGVTDGLITTGETRKQNGTVLTGASEVTSAAGGSSPHANSTL